MSVLLYPIASAHLIGSVLSMGQRESCPGREMA